MSFILEALRKAATEREQGTVPGLSSKQRMSDALPDSDWEDESHTDDDPAHTTGLGAPTWWLGVLLVAAGAGAGAWWATRPSVAPTPPPSLAQTEPQSTSSPRAPQETAAPATITPTRTVNERPQGAPSDSVKPVSAVEPAPTDLRPAASAAASGPAAAERGVASPSPSVAPAVSPTAPRAADLLPRLEDLSIGLQQSIPKLAVSGAMVSDDAASRILIINGLVLHEGEAVAPDLRLERIEHKAAVLNYKGTRFLLRY